MSEKSVMTLDIIIPSFRVDTEILQNILKLEQPIGMKRKMIVILDNPGINIPDECRKLGERDDVSIFINETNIGAGGSRNRGIENSTADWILFLDDDIHPDSKLLHVYGEIIENYKKNVPGHVGVTRFPKPNNSFTRGFVSSSLLYFFDLPDSRADVTWGATSNILFNRKAIGNHRFGYQFPKAGGGEDVDFCFKIQKEFGTRFASAPKAIVHHPWWNNSKRSYNRSFRWGFSDTMLPSIYNDHSWRDLPNTVETTAIFLLIAIPMFLFSVITIMDIGLIIGMIIIGELISEWFRQLLTNSVYNPITAIESSIIRLAFALGGVHYIVSSSNYLKIGNRFDYGYNEWSKKNRRWSILRLSTQVLLIILCFCLYS
jgi:glycosyltransferase involved in cell wall biosynthesis